MIIHHCAGVSYILQSPLPDNIAQLHTECMNFIQTQLIVMELPFAIFFSSKDEILIYEAEQKPRKPKVKPAISNTAIYF